MPVEQFARRTDTVVSIDPKAPLVDSLAAERLRSLYEIGTELLVEREPERVIRTIQSAIVARLAPDHACVLSAKNGVYRVLAAHEFDLTKDQEAWPVSHTVLRQVADTGLALLAVDAAAHPQVGNAASIEALQIRSILCVPLGGHPLLGLVYLDRRAGRPAFTKADLEFLSAIAGYASLVLERTQEHERVANALRTSDERLDVLRADLLRHRIVGRSPKLLAAYDAVTRLAAAGARVLLRGETGTGKELFARAYALKSPRSDGAYVPIPVPSLASTLIESELFGHGPGVFSEASREKKGRLEVADGGVLFFDEIGDVAPEVQVKLLRFLDSGEITRVGETAARSVDALIVSATNRAIEADVDAGRMRADLRARLGHEVVLPPLRDRREDIPLLVEACLENYGGRVRGQSFSERALARLSEHDWPFNVRELQQVVERALCLSGKTLIDADDLPGYVGRPAAPASGALSEARAPVEPTVAPSNPGASLREVVAGAERRHIVATLERANGHRRRAAEWLGISADTLYRRLKDLGISSTED